MEILANALRPEKEIKGIQIGKEETKLSLFVNAMIIYVKSPKELTKKTPGSNKQLCCMIQGQYMSIAFLQTSNEQVECEIKYTTPLIFARNTWV